MLSTAALRIVCSDPIDAVAVDTLTKHGFTVDQVDASKMEPGELQAAVAGAAGLIVRS